MRDTPSLQPQTPTRSVSAGRWSRATARARAVSRVRRGLAPGDAAAGPSQEVADTWKEYKDPGSGHSYWYNAATKESSWTAPATLASVNVAQDAASDVRRGASPARSSTPPRLQAAVRKARAANRPARKDHDEPQFTEHWDEETGRAYFVNKKTGASSWRRPAGAKLTRSSVGAVFL